MRKPGTQSRGSKAKAKTAGLQDYCGVTETREIASPAAATFQKQNSRQKEYCRNERTQPRPWPGATRERIYRSLLESANVIFNINSRGRITSISPSIKQFTGHTREELIGQNFTRFIYPQDVQVVRQSIARAGPDNNVHVEFRLICKNGEIRYVRATSLAHIDVRGVNKQAVTGIITDISGHKKTQEQLRNCALYDSLTGLFNRSCFQKELSRGHPPGNAGIIVCDVDGLKQFNDLFGHSKGDAVLVAAAGMIENCCPSSSLIARTGATSSQPYYMMCGKRTSWLPATNCRIL